MAKMRVHDLAKEYGMQSKEMLEHLAEMKIPAKSPSSTLEDAYVAMARKKLKPILEARAAEIRKKQAEAKKREEEEKKRAAAEAEAERLAAEKRREVERAAEEKKRAAEEAARKKAEAQKAAQAEAERKAAEEAERKRVKDTAPKSTPSFNTLLDQIAQQEEVLKQQAAESAAQKKSEKSNRNHARAKAEESIGNERRNNRYANRKDLDAQEDRPSQGRRKKNRRGGEESEDRYSRMAREAEAYNRSKVLDEARRDIEEASRESTGRRKKRKERRQKQAAEAAMEQRIEEALANDQDISQLDTVKVPQGSTVSELADLLGVSANDIIKRLFLLGSPLTLTETMSDDLIDLVAEDLGREIKIMTKEEENSFTFYDDPKDLKPRPPVVTVMGHVDHGKTSLLDAIRNTNVTAGESGGITQHIGASEVKINGKKIVFLDTPGHEAFTTMRARGAQVTDIAVLVVAADDSVKPQTIESISHAKAANVPMIVAINKIDKPGANVDRVKKDLADHGVLVEDWGGDVISVPVSAKKGEGITDLLEMILLQAEVLELRANPDRLAMGTVIEARLDKSKGPIATLLVTNGTLKAGQSVVAGTTSGKIRVMTNFKGEAIRKALPATPVEILGLSDVPMAGDSFNAVKDDKVAREIAESRQEKMREDVLAKNASTTLEKLFSQIQEGETKELNLIIKGDVQGSVGAIISSLEKLDTEDVRVNVIHSGVGTVTESDVMLAETSGAIIIGFNVRPTTAVQARADDAEIEIRTYRVIYDIIDDVQNAMKGMLDPEYKEEILGKAEIRETFKVPNIGIIGGAYIVEGKVKRNAQVRLVRDGIVIHEGTISSLRRFKDDAKEVAQGYECGIGIEAYNDIKPMDIIECFHMVEIER